MFSPPSEAAGQIDVEPTLDTSTSLESLPVNEQLSPEVSELDELELSHHSDKDFRYNAFYKTHNTLLLGMGTGPRG